MSQENVEIVRADLSRRGTRATWTPSRELYDPDVIVLDPDGWPEPGPCVGGGGGHALVRASWRETSGRRHRVEPISEFIDVGDRRCRAVHRRRGDASGVPEASMEFTHVFTVRKGKIVAVEYFWDHAEALEAVGLSEQDAHADS